jgi:Na+-driven multidrug efflux pump
MPGFGFSLACAALVGQRLGAARPDEAARSMKETAKMSLLVMSAMGLCFLVLAQPLIRISTADAQIVELGAMALRIGALEQPAMSLAFVLQGLLRGAADTKSPLMVALIGMWLVRAPLAYALALKAAMGLNGIWLTTVLDWSVRAALLWAIYRRGRWKRIAL